MALAIPGSAGHLQQDTMAHANFNDFTKRAQKGTLEWLKTYISLRPNGSFSTRFRNDKNRTLSLK
jgi:hypothetical protein